MTIQEKLKPTFKPTIGLYVSIFTIFLVLILFLSPYSTQNQNNSNALTLQGNLKVYVDNKLIYDQSNTIDVGHYDFLICKAYNDSNGCTASGLSSTTQNKAITAIGLSTQATEATTCEGLITGNSLDAQLASTSHVQNSNSVTFTTSWTASGAQNNIQQAFLMVYNGDSGLVEASCLTKTLFSSINLLSGQSITIQWQLSF